MLTKSQRQTLENLAALSGEVHLYKDPSLSGQSETLRYKRHWVEMGRWGMTPRTRSGMILSVKINVLPDGSDDPASITHYNALCDEAVNYFNSLRRNHDRHTE